MECTNCNYKLNDTVKFCPSCGNPIICNRLTNKSLLNEFTAKYLTLESKLWVTIKDMTIRPERVIKSYIGNNRVKYLPPINFMLVAALFGGFYAYLLNNGYLGEIDLNAFTYTPKNDVESLGLKQEEITKSINTNVQNYYSLITFLTIPLLALLSKLVFHNYKQYNYAEHVVIYAYAYSQYLILSYISIPFMIFIEGFAIYYTTLVFFVIIGWHAFVLKRVFELSLKNIIIKSLFFLTVAIFLLVVFFFIGIIVALALSLILKTY